MKRKQKVQRYKARKAKEIAVASREKFINPRDVRGVRGHELRDETLGKEFKRRSKAGGIVDKREGGDTEDDSAMLSRMKQVRLRKADSFKLSDTSDTLTHYGSALGAPIRKEEEPEQGEQQPARKTRNEVLDEIIDKSRAYRDERRQAADERNADIKEIDSEFREVSSLLKYRHERKTALPEGLSIAPIPGTDPNAPPAPKKSRVLVLAADGSVKETRGYSKPDKATQEEMDKILREVRKENKAAEKQADKAVKAAVAAEAAAEPAEKDEYDKLMMDLESSTIAKAGSRTKSNSELAAEAQAELLRLQREKARRMHGKDDDSDDDAHAERQLYTPRYSADDTQEVRDSKARKQASSLFESYMGELEEQCKPNEKGIVNVDFAHIDSIVGQLHNLTGVSPMASCMTARGMVEVLNELLEAEVRHNASQADDAKPAAASTTPFALIVPAIFAKIFPPSDFRHPVSTPLALYLASTLSQTRLLSLRHVAAGLFRAGVLLDMTAETHRYCGEVLSFLANVLSLQCAPEAHAAPASGQKRKRDEESTLAAETRRNALLPLSVATLSGTDGIGEATGDVSMLAPKKGKKVASTPLPFDVFCSPDQKVQDTASVRHQLVLSAYRIAEQAVGIFGAAASTESLDAAVRPIADVLRAVEGSGADSQFTASDAVKEAHVRLGKVLEELSARSVAGRVPLQLQTHRPIPLPLYTCKVTDFEEGEEDEKRQLKKEFRDTQKKAIRDLRKDARYLNAAKEEERRYDNQQREDKLNQITAELQGQRSMIKLNDVAQAKNREMQKKAKRG
eukprot:TRINITY_DN913_c1_g1_i1.p1 TRINITY_DN913_c1_g1~~TRINITY_DN913_c1_g1_i1.p1  ORF type:complete len:795 (+),score=364.64 TRINITY_DN913_c1_g1_i1:212-2596(+)